MKKLFVSIAILAMGMQGMALMAQRPQPTTPPHMQQGMQSAPRPGSDMSMCYQGNGQMQSMLFQGMNLTPGQQKQLQKLYEKRNKEMQKAQKKAEKEQAKFEKELAKILNPAQMAQYHRNRSKIHGHGPMHPQTKGKKGRGNKAPASGVIGEPQPGPRPMILTR